LFILFFLKKYHQIIFYLLKGQNSRETRKQLTHKKDGCIIIISHEWKKRKYGKHDIPCL